MGYVGSILLGPTWSGGDLVSEILEVITNISDLLVTLFNSLQDFFADLFYVVELTGSFVLRIPSYLSWLPSSVISVFVIAFGVVVIYKVLGREG